MTEQNGRDPQEGQPHEGYEAPRIEELGSVAELTQTIGGSLDA
jgi:hypothetical protein